LPLPVATRLTTAAALCLRNQREIASHLPARPVLQEVRCDHWCRRRGARRWRFGARL